ncbi:MAG: Fur family transcriptional regulator [Alphaproteobacteria bacterium]|nr:Fur family transcriptional regulator [Alphaproteobacteria bacterium]
MHGSAHHHHAPDDLPTQLDRAAAICAARGAQLTPLRRQVLGLVLAAEQPIGAYALLERLKTARGPAAPPTIYRALDFLLEQGLVHKLERLNSFTGCVAAGHSHAHQFLICTRCGQATELHDHAIEHALQHAAEHAGFRPERMTVEIEGLCAACAG